MFHNRAGSLNGFQAHSITDMPFFSSNGVLVENKCPAALWSFPCSLPVLFMGHFAWWLDVKGSALHPNHAPSSSCEGFSLLAPWVVPQTMDVSSCWSTWRGFFSMQDPTGNSFWTSCYVIILCYVLCYIAHLVSLWRWCGPLTHVLAGPTDLTRDPMGCALGFRQKPTGCGPYPASPYPNNSSLTGISISKNRTLVTYCNSWFREYSHNHISYGSHWLALLVEEKEKEPSLLFITC